MIGGKSAKGAQLTQQAPHYRGHLRGNPDTHPLRPRSKSICAKHLGLGICIVDCVRYPGIRMGDNIPGAAFAVPFGEAQRGAGLLAT